MHFTSSECDEDSLLHRCARHFESPYAENGDNEFPHKLKQAMIYQSDEVTETVSLELDGCILARQTTRGNLHLETDDSTLRIYVSKDREDREVCYFTRLPERLATHWSIIDKAAVKVIGNALTAPNFAVNGILLENGIPEMPSLQQFMDAEPDDEGKGESGHTGIGNQTSEPTYARAYSSSVGPMTSSVSSYLTTNSAESISTHSRATTPEMQNMSMSMGRQTLSPRPSIITAQQAISQVNSNVEEYTKLLDSIINAGRSIDFPCKSALEASNTINSDTINTDSGAFFGVRSQGVMAHDVKIGAAGELFVCAPIGDSIERLNS